MRREVFAPVGMLMLLASAHAQVYNAQPPAANVLAKTRADYIQNFGESFRSTLSQSAQISPVAVVRVRGPLQHHESYWEDNYDAIRARVGEALNSAAACVVIVFDSPGGVVAGCFDTARAIRAMAIAASKPVHAHIEGTCASAAYALACACDTISTSSSAVVGSIGVINCLIDVSAADAQMGIKFSVVKSGMRKADSNVHVPTEAQAVAAEQRRVDDLAEQFFAWAAERRAMSVESVRGLNADTYIGARAQTLQLADTVETFDSLVARLALNPTGKEDMATKAEGDDDKKKDDTLDAIVAATQDEDPKKSARAKKALTAYLEDDGEKPDAEGDDKPAEDDKDDKPAAAAPAAPAASVDPGVQALARVHELEAREEQREERTALLASRPDFSKDLVEALRDGKRTPLATVRHLVKTLPKGKAAVVAAAPAQGAALPQASAAQPNRPTQGGPARGAAAVNPAGGVDDATEERRRRMGMTSSSSKPIIKREGHKMIFQVVNETIDVPEGAN